MVSSGWTFWRQGQRLGQQLGRNRGLAALLAIGLGVAVFLGGCSADQIRVNSARGSQLVVAGVDPKTFNYLLSQEVPNVFNRIYSGLLTEDGITGELSPGLAESWEVSPDKLRITFTLHEGLKWSDGAPLTADDVVFTFNDLVFNEKVPTSNRDALRIGQKGLLPQVRKIDDRRIEFISPEPFAPLVRAIAGGTDSGVAILPKHILEKTVRETDSDGQLKFLSTWGTNTDPSKIVGSGPYVMSSYTPNERVIFQRNPYYWRKDAQGNPLPYIERLIWSIVDSGEASLMQFRSGDLDVAGVGAATFSLLKKEEKRGKFTIINSGASGGASFITFNQNQGKRNGKPLVDPVKSRWFNTLAFRQAVAYAIDRRTMINNLYRGLGEPLNSSISVPNPYHLPAESGRIRVYDFDPEKSKKLLLDAGFKYDNQGQLFDADGNRVRFTLLSVAGGSGNNQLEAQLQRDLERIGIQLDLQLVTFNVLLDKTSQSLDWECIRLGFSDPDFDPNGGTNVWQLDGRLHMFNQSPSPDKEPIEGRVIADWEARMAQLYAEGAQTLDETKRKEIYAQTQILAQENLPFINLVNSLSMVAVRNDIQGVKPSLLKGTFWNIYELKRAKS
ncbi:MAG: ABC transporter substrate-binding protein [Drouetiella hepatica Uher 2000/2452]|uniref:ABC transporter substrate-binding protein n=1 Tax=Drouetiella hepatica Uher 2000/2452 TaxID=904376 RepID=A0A951QAK0_9CYAN|nr:ABC transporter substrate-binding protein [Drouetiella hepatica Uher 2000/2452]